LTRSLLYILVKWYWSFKFVDI